MIIDNYLHDNQVEYAADKISNAFENGNSAAERSLAIDSPVDSPTRRVPKFCWLFQVRDTAILSV
jgi:hypothetical protein